MPSFSELAQILTALAAIGAVWASVRNGKKIADVHLLINSRMTELLKVAADAARSEGREAGRKDEVDREKKVT